MRAVLGAAGDGGAAMTAHPDYEPRCGTCDRRIGLRRVLCHECEAREARYGVCKSCGEPLRALAEEVAAGVCGECAREEREVRP
jgi:predicted amidophosphoribosyltransferase